MSKKSLLTESEIARFKELAGIPLSNKETKMLHENKYSVDEMKHDKKDKKKHEKEELDEAYDELDEAIEGEEEEQEEEMEDEGEEMGGEESPEMGGDEELDLDMADGESEGLDAGDELESGEMDGGSPEELIKGLLSQISMIAKELGVSMQISGDEGHAEPDADNMGGPSDMDADNMGDMEGGEDEEMEDMEDEESEEEESDEEEELEEGYEELDELRYIADREEDPRAADRLSESALRQIAQRVNSRLSASISPTTRKQIVETITNRVAARLISEAKKAKKGIKEKMKSKKDMKAMKEGAKKAGKGHGPGNKTFGTKESVANQYKLNKVKLPKNKGGKDTVVAKGGASGTLPKGAGKGGKASKSNTTN